MLFLNIINFCSLLSIGYSAYADLVACFHTFLFSPHSLLALYNDSELKDLLRKDVVLSTFKNN